MWVLKGSWSGLGEAVRLNDDQVTIDVLHVPLRFTIFTLIFVMVALFIFVLVLYGGEGFEIVLLLVGGSVAVIVVGFWPIRLRLDGVGVTYRRWLFKKTIIWNDLTDVVFDILPPPDYEKRSNWIEDYSRFDRFYSCSGTSSIMTAVDLFSPLPPFQCSMTFMGDKVIVMKTERYDGPSVKEFRAAWEYVNSKQPFFNFELKMTKPHAQSSHGFPQLLKPV